MRLTKYPEGTVRELCAISFPLMLSSFSVTMMIFVDRLLLARYSVTAMNAAVNASTLGWAFIVFMLSLAGIVEVFVSQYNGAGQKEKIGEPTWQMLWFSLGSCLLFIPFAIWGTPLLYGNDPIRILERDYFFWLVLFGPAYGVYGALCGFFIGQGRLVLITCLSLAANAVNILFDVLFIFGVKNYIPEMGVAGAAMATNIGIFFQIAILFICFLSKKNREECGTNYYQLKIKSFLDCFNIGLPRAIFATIEMLGYAVYYWLMSLAGEFYITIAGICQSLLIFLYFLVEGVGNATIAIAGNYIGAKKHAMVAKMLKAGVRLHLLFLAITLTLFAFNSTLIIGYFLPYASPEELALYQPPLTFCLFGMLIYLFTEGIRYLFAGVVIASGDTLFLLLGNGMIIWIFYVLPAYVAIVWAGFSVEWTVAISLLYSCTSIFMNSGRYLLGSWQKRSLIN